MGNLQSKGKLHFLPNADSTSSQPRIGVCDPPKRTYRHNRSPISSLATLFPKYINFPDEQL